jgi:hypothetical protein
MSANGSLLFGIGIWLDDQLKVVAQLQRSFFKSSADMQKKYTTADVPNNVTLFTADAVSYYTNIPTDKALQKIAKYLRDNTSRFPTVPINATIEALEIIVCNNFFTFGDTTWIQNDGTAMGTTPAPSYATIYYGVHEDTLLVEFEDNLWEYSRFIDDVVSGWIAGTNPVYDLARWTYFKMRMNDDDFEIEWTIEDRSNNIDFMDLTLTLNNNRITSTLYEKPSNLHLYIPPHSTHPPGFLTGLIMGMSHRIHTLCTDPNYQRRRMKSFYLRLKARGYKPTDLLPIFRKAAERIRTPIIRQEQGEEEHEPHILFHVQYHPNGPTSYEIQRAWRETISCPDQCRTLASYRSHEGTPIALQRMIVCYSRPHNLGNLLSYRNINTGTGPPVSSYRITNSEGP